MTAYSRPLTDYKKTVLMVGYIKQYKELSVTLLDLLEQAENPSLTKDELDELNIALNNMISEMNEIIDYISIYNGKY